MATKILRFKQLWNLFHETLNPSKWPKDRLPTTDDGRIACEARKIALVKWEWGKSHFPLPVQDSSTKESMKAARLHIINELYGYANSDPNHVFNADLYGFYSGKFQNAFQVPLSRFWPSHIQGFDIVAFDNLHVKVPSGKSMSGTIHELYGEKILEMIHDFVSHYPEREFELYRQHGFKPSVRTGNKKARNGLKRKLQINGIEWTYQIGSGGVVIRTPDRLSTVRVPMDELTGLGWDALERREWKGSSVKVGPGDVKDYIIKHLAKVK